MDRKRAMQITAAGAVATALVVAVALGADSPVSAPGPAVAAENPPNILIIVTDDQRANSLGFMPKTRSWFGKGGRTYRRAVATNPVCCPSRASIFTGDYSHNNGVKTNYDTEELDHSETLHATLEAAGYQTYITGKFLNDWDIQEAPPHFDKWAIFVDENEGPNFYRDEIWNVDGVVDEDPAYTTTRVGDHALDFVEHSEADDDRPWVMYVFPFAPHAPYTPQKKYADADVGRWPGNPAVFESRKDKPPWVRSESADLSDGRKIRNGQLRTLMSVDDQVGRIMKKLGETEERPNTLAFYTSDNGLHWGEHGLLVKRFPYLPAYHIPMLVRWPEVVPAESTSSKIVANIDIAATALEAAGQPVAETDGRSMLAPGRRDHILLEGYRSPGQPDDLPDWAATYTPDYQYTEYYGSGGKRIFREYYNLKPDPFQIRNLLGDGNPDNNPSLGPLSEELNDDRDCATTADCP